MMTNRQMLALILRRQAVLEALLLLVLREERNIELSQQDIDAAVVALGSTASDLKVMAQTTNSRITDVDTEVQELKAQLAAMDSPVDTSALDAAMDNLRTSHDLLHNAVASLADDVNVPQAGQGTGEVGSDTPAGSDSGADATPTTGEPDASGEDVSVPDQS